MRKTRRAVAALAVAAAAACFTAEAQAADSISFGDQGTKATFGANRVVSIDGTITYRDDCPVPGIKDFFYPATDVYLVPPGTGAGDKLHDVGGGSPNTIVSGASMFLDETIAMTAPAGNLDEGEYDVVFDTCQDGYYDPGYDTIFPDAVTVTLPDVLPLADNGIKAIKDESREEYHSWLATKFAMQAMFKLADQALKTECMAGSPVGCVLKHINYFSGVKERFLALVLSQANHYRAIADDPPDTNFDKATTIEPLDDLPRDHSDAAFSNAVSDALQPFAGEAALNGALLHAIERYQGAQAAGDRKWALVHAREARNLTETLRRIAPATSDALGDMKAAVSSDSTAFDHALSEGRTFAHRVWGSGFTGAERRALLNEGMTHTQIAKVETETRDLVADDRMADSAPLLTALDQARAAHAATVSALSTSAGKWDEIVKVLEAKPGPAAVDAGGPYTAVKGAAVALAGSGSGAAAWDLDADGAFDDATGFTPSVTFNRAGTFVIGVKAGDSVSYAVVTVTDANHAPVLSAPVPANREATITVGGALPLSVTANDSDADSLAYSWTIDGADAHDSDASLTYSPAAAQVGSHAIEVTVADGHGGTTRRAWDIVVLDHDADNDGWTKTTDCDDTDPAVHPTANELLGNGVNDDCDASTPDAPPGGLTGSIMSWGSNHNGTIGNGSSSPTLVSSPVAIPGLDNVVQVDNGDRAGYAVLANGEVRSWGFDGEGGLGNGTLNATTATPVAPLAVGGAEGSKLTGVTQLAAENDGHVLARRGDGTVVAWGQNQARQVGDGSTVNYRLYPVQVVTGDDGAPLTGVREVEAGVSDSYAIMDDGTVRAWGYVRCDGGTSLRPERFPVPLPMVGGGVKQISAGNQFTLILKKDGTVLSCGAFAPAAGRPIPTIQDVYVPKQVTGFGPGRGVIDITAGFEGGMALKSDGSLWAWGANNNWELGILGYDHAVSINAPTQVTLPPGPPVVDVEMDNSCHGLALRADGSLLGFGCDFFEQVGNGDGPGSGVMTPTVLSTPGKTTFATAAENWNGLALTRPLADDWKAPATWVTASVADATVGEAGGKFKVSLSAALPDDVTVGWSAEAGTAGSDDVSLVDGTSTVPAGATSVEVDAPVKDDALDEDAETFAVVLHDASNGVQLDRSQATVTIEDNDGPPSVSVRPVSVVEGNTSLNDVPVKVRLSEASGKPVSVSFATADGTAVSPGDYAPATGKLVIAPGDVEGIVHVAVRGDTVVEPDEALSVALSAPDNATLADASAALTIKDDEPFAVSVTSPSVPEGNSGTTPATFTVALSAAPLAGSSVSVDYHVAGVTATVPGDVAAAGGTLTFAAGEKAKQVTVQVQGDTEDEGDEAFRLALSNLAASGDRVVLRGENPVATIVDDDDATPPPPPPPPPADSTAPVTTATSTPAPNAAGWSTQNVTVALAATDNAGGSGVKQIVYTVGGVAKTVAGATATVPVTAEGATTIAYHAVDNAGNVEADKTLVVRIDNTAPTVTCSANPKTLWPADHRLVPITITVKVTDSRSGTAGFTLQSVTSNEPDDAPGSADGATTGDITGFSLGTADVSGQLRAERSTSGHGRVYTLTYVGRDAAGNQRTCTTTVSVPVGCTGAHALTATREVQHARRKYARRLHHRHVHRGR